MGKVRSRIRYRINIPDPQHVQKAVLRVGDPVIFLTLDPGWEKIQSQDPGSGKNIPDIVFE